MIIKAVSQQLKINKDLLIISWLTINPPPSKKDWVKERIIMELISPGSFKPLGKNSKKLIRIRNFNMNLPN